MYNQNPYPEATQLRMKLERLSNQISSLSTHLLNPTPAEPPTPEFPILPSTPPPSPTRFSRLTNLFPGKRRSLRRKGRYQDIDEKPLLGLRRDSDDTDKTLVNHTWEGWSAEELLRELSDPISRLQRVGNRLSALQGYQRREEDLISLFKRICGKLLELLDSLKTPCSSKSDCFSKDEEYDSEMRNLMLSALIKKVTYELNRFSENNLPFSNFQNLNKKASNSSLSVNPFKNPFVVHSTSLSSNSSSTLNIPNLTLNSTSDLGTEDEAEILFSPNPSQLGRRESKPIKINLRDDNNSFEKGDGASFSSKSDIPINSTNTNWAQNLIRLGSYQASLLFSNSPIAVKRLNGDGRRIRV